MPVYIQSLGATKCDGLIHIECDVRYFFELIELDLFSSAVEQLIRKAVYMSRVVHVDGSFWLKRWVVIRVIFFCNRTPSVPFYRDGSH